MVSKLLSVSRLRSSRPLSSAWVMTRSSKLSSSGLASVYCAFGLNWAPRVSLPPKSASSVTGRNDESALFDSDATSETSGAAAMPCAYASFMPYPWVWSQERSSTRNPSSPIAANSVMPMFTSAAVNATCLTSFHCPLAPFTSSR